MKNFGARATTYLVVALLLVVALRYTPEIPDRRPAEVLQQATPLAAATQRPVTPRAPLVARTEHLARGETLTGLLKRAGIVACPKRVSILEAASRLVRDDVAIVARIRVE